MPMRNLILILLITTFYQAIQASVVEDLAAEIAILDDGEHLLLEYTFEGCFGPYHHGTVFVESKNGALHYLTKSFDDKNKPGISQAGKYEKEELLALLEKAREKNSNTVFGNAISYRLSRDEQEILRNDDHIEQRHFIELFQPFTSIFPPKNKDIIPKISSGGFVH